MADTEVNFEFVGVKEEDLNDLVAFGLSFGDELVLDTEEDQQQFPTEYHEIDNFLQEQQQLSAEDYEINNFLQDQQQFPTEYHDEVDNFLQEQQQLSAEDYEINNFLQDQHQFPTEDDDEIKNFSFLDSHSDQNEFRPIQPAAEFMTNNDDEWLDLLMGLNVPVPVEEADNIIDEEQPSLSYEELEPSPAFVFPDNPLLEEEEDDKSPGICTCLVCDMFNATCIIEDDIDLPISPGYLCLGCYNLWPKKDPPAEIQVHLPHVLLPRVKSKVKRFYNSTKEILKNAVESDLAMQTWRKVNKQDQKIDWHSIAQNVEALKSYDAKDLERLWLHYLRPDLQTELWTLGEITIFNSIVQQSTGEDNSIDWLLVASKLSLAVFKNKNKLRSIFDLISRYQRHHNPHHRKAAGIRSTYFWTDEDKDKLNSILIQQMEANRNGKINWREVTKLMPGTTKAQLYSYYRRVIVDPKPKSAVEKDPLDPLPPVENQVKKSSGGRRRKKVVSIGVELAKKLGLLKVIRLKRSRKLSLPGDGRYHGLIQSALYRIYGGNVDPQSVELDDDATEEKKVLLEIIDEMPVIAPELDLPTPAQCLPPTLHSLTGLRGLRFLHQHHQNEETNHTVKGDPIADQLLLNRLFKTFFWPHKMVSQLPAP